MSARSLSSAPVAGSSSPSSSESKEASNIAGSVTGHIATVVLDRPKKLNSLNMPMIRDLVTLYDAWLAESSPVRCVIMEGTGRAFCAGGDVAAVQRSAIEGGSLPEDFFFEEYELNNTIATMFERHGIPQIAIWDGITMGGGVGLSVHGKFRIATENTMFAKPETGIGLFPDVGGTVGERAGRRDTRDTERKRERERDAQAQTYTTLRHTELYPIRPVCLAKDDILTHVYTFFMHDQVPTSSRASRAASPSDST